MPTIPSVFRNVRKNDVHQRPFKTYKRYFVDNTEALSRKYFVQKGFHKKFPANVGDYTYNYPTNITDDTNQHVVWNAIDHKYYRFPWDETRCHELLNRNNVEKTYFISSSIITIPYHEMGERVKPGTLSLNTYVTNSSTNNFVEPFEISSSADIYGNLRDIDIPTASMASASRLEFYFTFNDQFRKFDDNYGKLKVNDSIQYVLRRRDKFAEASNIDIQHGPSVFVSGSTYVPSGLSGFFTGSLNSYVKVLDDQLFEQFQRCDNWLLSFWINPVDLTSTGVIASKFANIREQYYDPVDKITKLRTVNKPIPTPGTSIATKRMPLHISLINDELHFQASDGLNELHISASTSYRGDWSHIAIRNSASLCEIFINGDPAGSSGSLPAESTANKANLLFGTDTLNSSSRNTFNGNIAELRMYDYEASNNHIKSLAGNNFYTGSLYQTSRIGNVFHRNGQVVISSPMPKYHDMIFTGSGAYPNSFQMRYNGQHTIYENEVMVRVPRGAMNISVNPSATYRPATGINNDCNEDGGSAETYLRPGDYRKAMFVSGTANPYITTIGLYNDKAELLAVGKLAEPIEKRDDIDMNFIIRWDY